MWSTTFLGIIPGGVVFTSVGAGLGEVFATGETPDLGIIFAPHVLWPDPGAGGAVGAAASILKRIPQRSVTWPVIDTDICVIGAGSGGLSVAAGAVQMGARVVLIEGGEMGGDCLNTGCVPSKALIAAARGRTGAAARALPAWRGANPWWILPR